MKANHQNNTVKIIRKILLKIGVNDGPELKVDFDEGLSETEIDNLIYIRDTLNLCRNQMRYHLWKMKATFDGLDLFGEEWIISKLESTRKELPEYENFFDQMEGAAQMDVYLNLVLVNHGLECFYAITHDVELN